MGLISFRDVTNCFSVISSKGAKIFEIQNCIFLLGISMGRLSAVGVILAFVAIGAFLGWFAHEVFSFPPASHKSIIEAMNVIDTKANFYLTAKCVDYGKREWLKGLAVAELIPGKQYEHSTWIWQRHGDTDIVMTIWGPDETGQTCLIEIAKLSWNPFKIKINGQTVLQIPATASEEDHTGYYTIAINIQP